MAKSNTTSGQPQNASAGFPIYSSFNNELEPSNPGREYGKELARWAGIQLKGAGRLLKTLFVRVTTRIPKWKLNDVDTDSLRKRMSKINWNKDYYSAEAIARSERNPRLQRDIMRVNRIFRDMKQLSDSGHYMGEELRWKLQRKYWTNTRMQPQIGNTLNAVAPPGSYPSPSKTNIPSNSSARDQRVANSVSMGNTSSISQKQQENETRRIKIAYGGGRLGTSIAPRQHRPKRGLGL
jgi:hypothetical protein